MVEDGALMVNGWIWQRGASQFRRVVPLEVMLDATSEATKYAITTGHRLPVFWQRPTTTARIGFVHQMQLLGDRMMASGVVDTETSSGAVVAELCRSLGVVGGVAMRPVASDVVTSSDGRRVTFFRLVGVCAVIPEG